MSLSPAAKRLRRLGAASFSAIAAAGAIAGGAFLGVADARAQGVIFRGMGAVNESMGGAGIATSLDSAGAIYTNPAALSGLPQNEVSFGLGGLMPESSVRAQWTPKGIGYIENQVIPAQVAATLASYGVPEAAWDIPGAVPTLSTTATPRQAVTAGVKNALHHTDGNNHHTYRKSKKSTYYVPSFAVARHVDDWTFGCSVGAIGGASANYAGSDDPLTPTVLGPYGKSSKVKVIELMPTASYRFRDWLSVGVTAVVGCFSLQVDPMPFGLEATAPLYHAKTDYTFGGGFNVGALVNLDNFLPKPLHGFKVGLVFKSPVWAEPFQFSGAQGASISNGYTGEYTQTKFKFTLPLVAGIGFSYAPPALKGDLLLALDFRYFDYANTDGFTPSSVYEDGKKIGGLGWDSIVSVAVGAQYKVAEDFAVRVGYCWSENPIPGDVQFANVVAPLFIQHVASIGFTYTFKKTGTDITLAWSHAFKNSVSGTDPDGLMSVKNTVSAETIFIGLTQRF